MEILAGILAVAVVTVAICWLYNESYWKGYRNSKFIDELNKEDLEI